MVAEGEGTASSAQTRGAAAGTQAVPVGVRGHDHLMGWSGPGVYVSCGTAKGRSCASIIRIYFFILFARACILSFFFNFFFLYNGQHGLQPG